MRVCYCNKFAEQRLIPVGIPRIYSSALRGVGAQILFIDKLLGVLQLEPQI